MSSRTQPLSFLGALCRLCVHFPLLLSLSFFCFLFSVFCFFLFFLFFFVAVVAAVAGSNRPKKMTSTSKLPQAKTYYPTEQEWQDPMVYISSIEPEAQQYGIVKVSPPKVSTKTACVVCVDKQAAGGLVSEVARENTHSHSLTHTHTLSLSHLVHIIALLPSPTFFFRLPNTVVVPTVLFGREAVQVSASIPRSKGC